MSSSKDESQTMSNVSRLRDSVEPSLAMTSSFDHVKEDIPFRVVHRIHRAIDLSAPTSPPTPVVAVLVASTLVHTTLASVASTMTREDVIHLQGMYSP